MEFVPMPFETPIAAMTPHSRKSADFVILRPEHQDFSDKDFIC
jgi:hypothetical protein